MLNFVRGNIIKLVIAISCIAVVLFCIVAYNVISSNAVEPAQARDYVYSPSPGPTPPIPTPDEETDNGPISPKTGISF